MANDSTGQISQCLVGIVKVSSNETKHLESPHWTNSISIDTPFEHTVHLYSLHLLGDLLSLNLDLGEF